MKNIYSILLSVASLGAGFGIGYIFFKKKFEKKADDEISKMREQFNNRLKEIIKPEPKTEKKSKSKSKEKVVVKDINKTIAEQNQSEYVNYSAPYRSKKSKSEALEDIYIITPEQFTESEYNVVTILYYEDGTFTDDDGNIIYNPKDIFGNINVAKSFGQYEEDSVYIRNYSKKIDYEVLLKREDYSSPDEEHPEDE